MKAKKDDGERRVTHDMGLLTLTRFSHSNSVHILRNYITQEKVIKGITETSDEKPKKQLPEPHYNMQAWYNP